MMVDQVLDNRSTAYVLYTGILEQKELVLFSKKQLIGLHKQLELTKIMYDVH